MTRKYFGTDGVRGKVGEHPITADWILRLGRAVGIVLAATGGALVSLYRPDAVAPTPPPVASTGPQEAAPPR